MAWQITNDRPVYIQLVEQIQQKILTKEYKVGDKLPSVRELAKEAGVNPNTMQKAFQELERKGIVYTNRTSGRFITDNQQILKMAGENQAMELVGTYYHGMKAMGYECDKMITMVQNFDELEKKKEKGEK